MGLQGGTRQNRSHSTHDVTPLTSEGVSFSDRYSGLTGKRHGRSYGVSMSRCTIAADTAPTVATKNDLDHNVGSQERRLADSTCSTRKVNPFNWLAICAGAFGADQFIASGRECAGQHRAAVLRAPHNVVPEVVRHPSGTLHFTTDQAAKSGPDASGTSSGSPLAGMIGATNNAVPQPTHIISSQSGPYPSGQGGVSKSISAAQIVQ